MFARREWAETSGRMFDAFRVLVGRSSLLNDTKLTARGFARVRRRASEPRESGPRDAAAVGRDQAASANKVRASRSARASSAPSPKRSVIVAPMRRRHHRSPRGFERRNSTTSGSRSRRGHHRAASRATRDDGVDEEFVVSRCEVAEVAGLEDSSPTCSEPSSTTSAYSKSRRSGRSVGPHATKSSRPTSSVSRRAALDTPSKSPMSTVTSRFLSASCGSAAWCSKSGARWRVASG